MRILFVDDDPDTRALAVRAVMQEFEGAESVEAMDRPSLEAALAAGPVDALVSDYDLRWIDGLKVYGLTKAAHPECVAVMFTGTGNEELAVRAMKAGFDDYVVKAPGQLKRLASSTRLAVERSTERRLLRDNRELLRQELYHRLHNNLQIVISLMGLTLRGIADPEAKGQLRALKQRIQSLSLLQEQFYRTDDLRRVDIAGFIETLAADLGRAAPHAVVKTNVQPLFVAVDRAVPLGLIANELMMDLLSLDQTRACELIVILSNQINTIELTVTAKRNEKGQIAQPWLSLDLITRLAEQLGAQVSRDYAEVSATTRVTFKP